MERALGTWSMGRLGSICYPQDTSVRRQGVLKWPSSNVRTSLALLMYCRVSFNVTPT